MMSRGTPEAEAALWMLAQLDPASQDSVRRRLALRLDPPISPLDRRLRELRFVAELLRPLRLRPGWSFAYTPRKDYDARRPPDAPSSASLIARYGSWAEVCLHAYVLVAAATPRGLGLTSRKRGKRKRRYCQQDAVAALQECARELNRIPSPNAYWYWRAAAERRYRITRGYPSQAVVTRLYAKRGGWIAALEDAELVEPPAMTVRVMVPSKEQAADLAAVARAAGLVAAHAGNRNWLEVRGTFGQIRHRIVDCTRSLEIAELTLWEPRTMTCEPVDLASETSLEWRARTKAAARTAE
jgi:hypothetical protein